MSLAEQLNFLLEEVGVPHNSLGTALDLMKQVRDTEIQLAELRSRLALAHDHLNGELAMGVRKRLPSLNVSLDKNGCRVGYKSKHLIFNPDLNAGVWQVRSPDGRFLARFRHLYGPKTALVGDLEHLIDAVVEFFINHYKSLNEEISGSGRLLIDGANAALLDLAAWRARTAAYE